MRIVIWIGPRFRAQPTLMEGGYKIVFKKVQVGIVAIVGLIVITHTPAKAGFTVCNHATYGPLMVAVAYEYSSGSDSWSRSEGFYYIPQGQCQPTLSDITGAESLYVFAWASSNQSIYWDGTANFSNDAKEFCVDGNSSAFVYRADAAEPPCSTGVMRTFRYAGTADDSGNLTYNLGNYSPQ